MRFHRFLIFISLLALSGCASSGDNLRRINQEQAATIQSLNDEIYRLNQELDQIMNSREQLARAKAELEQKLQEELASGNLSVAMQDRGLVVTMLDRILFDSGKAQLKTTSRGTLDKVAGVLKDKVGDHMIQVEGHTDNEPIKYSGWRSNWELSTARATEVIHYFVSERSLIPEGLAATGYGEFHPVADNATPDGRMKNRRVEIVITPRKLVAVGGGAGPA